MMKLPFIPHFANIPVILVGCWVVLGGTFNELMLLFILFLFGMSIEYMRLDYLNLYNTGIKLKHQVRSTIKANNILIEELKRLNRLKNLRG